MCDELFALFMGRLKQMAAAIAGKQDALTFDPTPTENSTNPVTSGGVYTALAGKEDTLTFDSEPTENSTNPVTSGGVYEAIRPLLTLTIESVAKLCQSGKILNVMDYGDQIRPMWTEGDVEYIPALNFCHEADATLEDQTTIHGAYFEWDKTTPTGVPFDAPEAIYYFDGTEVTEVGDCYITIGASYGSGWVAESSIQITLTAVPDAGDQLVISCGENASNDPTNGRTWNIYAKGDTTVKQTGTTSSGTSGTKLGETSSTSAHHTNGNVNAPSRAVYGYGRWSQSALRQRLNSTAAAGSWWTAQNAWDRPPAQASSVDGFLHGYDESVYRYFKPIKVTTIACNADNNEEDVTYDRVFLSSLEQMYCVPQKSGEGEYWEYYKRLLGRTTPAPTGATYPRLIKYALNAPTSAQNCWRRSAIVGYASGAWYVYSSGTVSYYSASYAIRCAPSVFVSK